MSGKRRKESTTCSDGTRAAVYSCTMAVPQHSACSESYPFPELPTLLSGKYFQALTMIFDNLTDILMDNNFSLTTVLWAWKSGTTKTEFISLPCFSGKSFCYLCMFYYHDLPLPCSSRYLFLRFLLILYYG